MSGLYRVGEVARRTSVTVRTLQEQSSLIATQVQALISAGALTADQGAGLSNKLAEIIIKLDQGRPTPPVISSTASSIKSMAFPS